jgi:hypothetical protein
MAVQWRRIHNVIREACTLYPQLSIIFLEADMVRILMAFVLLDAIPFGRQRCVVQYVSKRPLDESLCVNCMTTRRHKSRQAVLALEI